MHPTWTWVTPLVGDPRAGGVAVVVVCARATAAPPLVGAEPGSTAWTVVLSWDACWIWTPPSQCDMHGAAWTWVIVWVVVLETAGCGEGVVAGVGAGGIGAGITGSGGAAAVGTGVGGVSSGELGGVDVVAVEVGDVGAVGVVGVGAVGVVGVEAVVAPTGWLDESG